jgi:SRSO17 transposase
MVHRTDVSERRFDEYLGRIAEVLGHRNRHGPLRAYVSGLCLPGERKSIEPMAARVDPRRVRARHQSMHHFVSNAPWQEKEVIGVARDWVLEQMERHGAVAAWIVDDTGIPKKGRHSVGVARQYCGPLGKQDNCQVAVSVTLANEAVSVPAAYQLYLPESWVSDRRRRREVGVPEAMGPETKWQIALEQIRALRGQGLPAAPVVADAGYGVVTAFRDGLTQMGIPYVVGVSGDTTVWPPGKEPLSPLPYGGLGRPPTKVRRTKRWHPLSIRALAQQLPASAWKTITWRQGIRGPMRSRFALLRVRPAHRDQTRHQARDVEWLVIQWAQGDSAASKSWLSTMPPDTSHAQLVRLAKLRWRIERDYQELKDEFGLDHFEGRSWRGFHHHAALCIAAYAFLAAERARLSPPEPLSFLRAAPLPKSFKVRGSPRTATTAPARFDRKHARPSDQGRAPSYPLSRVRSPAVTTCL